MGKALPETHHNAVKGAAMATTAWRGAIEFSGFPINVALYGRVKSRSGDSFKTLDPVHKQPVKQQYVDINDEVVDRSETLKGVEVEKGVWTPLTPEAVEMIAEGERSEVLEPDSFSPLSTIDLGLALQTYEVLPDAKVAGSDKSVNTLWNGLRATGLAYVSRLTMRSGSRDAIVVFYATDHDLRAATLPFAAELNDVPSFTFEADEKQADLFRLVVGDDIQPFDLAAFQSEYRTRRQAAIDAALSGKKIAKPKAKKQAEPANDLMAALEAKVAAKGGKKAKAA
jgi:Ku protein